MVSKRGWLRITEATLAITLIVASIFIFFQDGGYQDNDDLADYIYQYTEFVFSNETLREEVYSGTNSIDSIQDNIQKQLSASIPRKDIDIAARLCEPKDECRLNLAIDKEIHTMTKFISTGQIKSGGTFNGIPKKVKIYIWKKE